jgi:hypothetical protein
LSAAPQSLTGRIQFSAIHSITLPHTPLGPSFSRRFVPAALWLCRRAILPTDPELNGQPPSWQSRIPSDRAKLIRAHLDRTGIENRTRSPRSSRQRLREHRRNANSFRNSNISSVVLFISDARRDFTRIPKTLFGPLGAAWFFVGTTLLVESTRIQTGTARASVCPSLNLVVPGRGDRGLRYPLMSSDSSFAIER